MPQSSDDAACPGRSHAVTHARSQSRGRIADCARHAARYAAQISSAALPPRKSVSNTKPSVRNCPTRMGNRLITNIKNESTEQSANKYIKEAELDLCRAIKTRRAVHANTRDTAGPAANM